MQLVRVQKRSHIFGWLVEGAIWMEVGDTVFDEGITIYFCVQFHGRIPQSHWKYTVKFSANASSD